MHHCLCRGCKLWHCASGGVTHWALAPDDDETVMTIAWGQNAANGTLIRITLLIIYLIRLILLTIERLLSSA